MLRIMAQSDERYRDPEYMAKWREANRERIKEYRKQRYLNHRKDEILAASRWISEHYDDFLLQRKAVSANARYPGTITTDDVRKIIEKCNGACHWCDKKNLKGRDLTIEHLAPVNNPDNIVLACFSCNCSRIPTRGRRKTEEERRVERKAYHKNWYLRNKSK